MEPSPGAGVAGAIVVLCGYEVAAAAARRLFESRYPPSVLALADREHFSAWYRRATPPALRAAGWLALGAAVGVAARGVHTVRHHPTTA
jgi:hypothetical protein